MRRINLYINILLTAAFTAATFTSCQKVIDIDLNSADPKIVIEGKIMDTAGPYVVKISKTANYFDVNTFPAISGASVIISDNAGVTDTLTETGMPGTYITNKLQGEHGKTYTLQVNADGGNYSAISYMPPRVEIDSLSHFKPEAVHFGPDRRQDGRVVRAYFKDPAGKGNYYLIKLYVNDTLANFNNNYLIYQDNYQDGNTVDAALFGKQVYPGDSVSVELLSIDRATYQYYNGLNDLVSRGGGSSAAPANPPGNISNNALGYFTATSISRRFIIIPR